MDRDEDFKEKYTEQKREFEESKHLIEIPPPQSQNTPGICYLPHHAVIRSKAVTTKVRMVFDASSRPIKGVSHNDIALKGPNIQETLFSIMIQFRCGKYVLCADIEKFYRQVNLNPKDWDTQRILWADKINITPKEFAITVVAFGTSSAPFLAQRALKQCAQDETAPQSLTRRVIEKNFYMDDLMVSLDNEENLLHLALTLRETLSKGGFPLTKFKSNSPKILEDLPKELCEMSPTELKENSDQEDYSKKLLGILWLPAQDIFTFRLNNLVSSKITRRTILASAASIYDPIGWISPVTTIAKFILRTVA
jgi:Reverse transcriptase (RNA-dependent DNA polymerase)/Pao retrotransposon peptidase